MTFLIIVTVVSLVIALVMSVVAWRAAGEERRRSEARVAGLATDIHSSDFDLRESPDFDLRQPIAETPAMSSDGLFGVVQPAEQGGRRFAIIGGIAVLVFGFAAVVLMLSGGSHTAAASQAGGTEIIDTASAVEHTSNAARPGSAPPLELVALGHDRDGDRLTVRGIVRNPPSGAAVDKLTAVVFMFDRDGNFLGSGRATVESSALGPGGESTFLVTVPGASSVGRYRVSFRTDDRVVPHVDRREHALARS
jgi:hypothetical protein